MKIKMLGIINLLVNELDQEKEKEEKGEREREREERGCEQGDETKPSFEGPGELAD